MSTMKLWQRAAVLSVVPAMLWFAPPAHADDGDDDDPNTTQQVCTGFDLGMSPNQIQQGLQRNDGRNNYWKAWRDSHWPIIEGDCP
jgi:hypothetical protein